MEVLGACETRFGPKQELGGMLVCPGKAANMPGSWGERRWLERTPLLGGHSSLVQGSRERGFDRGVAHGAQTKQLHPLEHPDTPPPCARH